MNTPLIEVPEHIQVLNPYDVDGPGVEFIRPIFAVIGVSDCHDDCLCKRRSRASHSWQRAISEPLASAAQPWTPGGQR